MKKILLFLIAFALISADNDRLVNEKGINLHIPEPSDICQAADGGYFVVSDNGYLYKLRSDYSIEQKSEKLGFDYEGVFATATDVYVSDESLRQIVVFNATDLKLKEIKIFNYQGGRNLGMESLTFDPVKKTYIGFTEKNPCILLKFDESFNLLGQENISGIREVSSATFYNGYLWVLSDEEMAVYKVDPNSFETIAKYNLSILNPEGICFSRAGKLLVVSDDMEEVFELSIPN